MPIYNTSLLAKERENIYFRVQDKSQLCNKHLPKALYQTLQLKE